MKFLFYKPLKVTDKDHNVLFWSDTHFGHRCEHWERPLWSARGFSSIEEHDEELIKRWNAKSNNSATFFHLGDFMFGHNAVDRLEQIVDRVCFKTLYLLPGNHCAGWKQWFEKINTNVWHLSPQKTVYFLPNYVEAYINGQPIVMSHFPILSFNGQGKGSYCLYGHVHGNLQKREIGKLYKQARTQEVSVEICPSPVSFGDIKKIMRDKEIVSFDHHDEKTLNPF